MTCCCSPMGPAGGGSFTINTAAPLAGGGPLVSGVPLNLSVADVSNTSKGVVPAITGAATVLFSLAGVSSAWTALNGGGSPLGTGRNINTTAPLGGGGSLAADLTLNVAAVSNVSSGVVPSVGAAGLALISSGVAGTWSTDFVGQTLTTTAGYAATGATSFFRVGLPAGSGAGVASSAATGGIRLPRGGGALSQIVGRNGTDTSDVLVLSWDSAGVTILGDSTLSTNTSLRAVTNLLLSLSGVNQVTLTTASMRLTPPQLSFLPTAVAPKIIQETLGGSTSVGQPFTVQAQQVGATVNSTGGAMLVAAGDVTQGSTSAVGGLLTVRGGDVTAGTGQVGGDLLLRSGVPTSGARGNVSIGGLVPNAQGMRNGVYLQDATALPTGAPTGGLFWYSNGGVPAFRTAANNILQLDAISAASATAGGLVAIPATCAEFITVTYNGNTRKLAAFAA